MSLSIQVASSSASACLEQFKASKVNVFLLLHCIYCHIVISHSPTLQVAPDNLTVRIKRIQLLFQWVGFDEHLLYDDEDKDEGDIPVLNAQHL